MQRRSKRHACMSACSGIAQDNRYEQKSDANKVNSAFCEYLLAARKLRSSKLPRRTYTVCVAGCHTRMPRIRAFDRTTDIRKKAHPPERRALLSDQDDRIIYQAPQTMSSCARRLTAAACRYRRGFRRLHRGYVHSRNPMRPMQGIRQAPADPPECPSGSPASSHR